MGLVALAVKQLAANRVLALVMTLGIVVAATLLAAAPIYSRAMADMGLTYTVRTQLQGKANTQVVFTGVGLGNAEGTSLRKAVSQRIDERIGWFRKDQELLIRLGRMAIAQRASPTGLGPQSQGELQSLSGYEAHVSVVEGRLPAPTDGNVIEVATSAIGAEKAGLKVGDVFDLRNQFDNCERELPVTISLAPPPACPITTAVAMTLHGKLTAIIEPIDDADPFWIGGSGRFFEPYTLMLPDTGPVVEMLTPEATVLDGLGALYPNYNDTGLVWQANADPLALTRTNFQRAHDDIVLMLADFEPLGGLAASPLRDALTGFGRSNSYQQTPLAVLLLEISGIAVFYVGLVAAIAVERQAGEIALLRGRGATLVQILSVYLVQGLVIGIPTALAAPFIAAGGTALLGLTPIFSGITGDQLLPATVIPLGFAMAAGAVALSIIALMVPALFAALAGATGVRRALSRPGVAIIQRYYLDLIFAAGALLLLFELRERGSVFTPSSTGGLSNDPLLLASPALAIVAAGALILRFAPMLLRMVARAANAIAGAATALALAQLTRNSGQYTRLTLLLMMAVAVGTFAASYTRTADRSYRDRADYDVGVDLRAESTGGSLVSIADRAQWAANAAKLPGVTGASTAIRGFASTAVAGNSGAGYQVLGIDPVAAQKMLTFRDDFAPQSLAALMAQISTLGPLPGRALPGTPDAISVWARADTPLKGQTLRAGIRDAHGRVTLVPVVDVEQLTEEWQEFKAPLDRLPDVAYPLTLVSLVWTGGSNVHVSPTALLDDVGVSTGGGPDTVVEDFEGPGSWAPFVSTATSPDDFEIAGDGAHSGSRAAKFSFGTSAGTELRGIYESAGLTPLPAVVSTSFLKQTGLHAGDTMNLRLNGFVVPMSVATTFDLFPTAPSDEGPVIVFNRDRLKAWAAIADPGLGGEIADNEIWLTLAPDADTHALKDALAQPPFRFSDISTRADAIAVNTKNPLVAASGSGILSAAFVAILALVAAALLTSLLAALRRRRLEIAVVRAIGFSSRQVLGMLAIEYAFVFVVGVSAGCALGLFVSSRMLSFLDVTETGVRVEPGFILETRWPMVAAGVLVVFAVFALALLLTARTVSRNTDAAALRGD